jgi:trans-2,3-dihydro-3-hydroxyanthranilate isomerase
MKSIPFSIYNSFTDTPFQGNPAGVFFDDEGQLSAEEMRRFCAEVSLESAFVLPAGNSGADYRLRYFTGVMEVPLCGHASVAAAAALVRTGRLQAGSSVTFATNVGPLPVLTDVNAAGGVDVTLRQTPLEIGDPLPSDAVAEIADALGWAAETIDGTGLPVQCVSTGTPWLIVPAGSREAIDTTRPEFAAITVLSERYGTFGIYAFARDPGRDGLAIWSRCFAPLVGLNEDPTTGSASGSLGWYLRENGILAGESRFTIRQGFAGGRGGSVRVYVTGERGSVHEVAVSGTATFIASGEFAATAR